MKRRVPWFVLTLLPFLLLGATPGAAQESKAVEIRPALLVIDVQNVWMPYMAEGDRTSAPPKINEAIALFRELGLPVICVYHTDPERGPAPNTEPFEFPETIAVAENDTRIIKNHPSAFTGTDLERVLREMDRNTVALCGLSATGCVLATHFGAMNRDFLAVLVEGALLSDDASHTAMIEDIFHSMSIEGMRGAFATD